MPKCNSVFQRIEKKYILTKEQYPFFLERIAPYMTLDQYGHYTICNIYYDTEADMLVRRSMEKPRYKEKLRLRTYGVPSAEQEAFVEIKKKYEKVVYKRRISLPYKEAVRYLNHGIHPENDSQIMKEIDYFLKFYHPEPKIFLAYDREAYFGKDDPDLRLTVDHNIRFRENELDLSAGDYGDLYFEHGEMVLEIKVAQAFPLWLTKILTDLEIYPVSFSKYGSCFIKKHLHKDCQVQEVPQKIVSGGY